MGQDAGVEDALVQEVLGDVAADSIVVHGDAAVFIRFPVKEDDRAGDMDGIEVVHIFIGHIRDDDAVEKFILHGFELFLQLVDLIRDDGQMNGFVLFHDFFLDAEGDAGQVVDTEVRCPVEGNGIAVLFSRPQFFGRLVGDVIQVLCNFVYTLLCFLRDFPFPALAVQDDGNGGDGNASSFGNVFNCGHDGHLHSCFYFDIN